MSPPLENKEVAHEFGAEHGPERGRNQQQDGDGRDRAEDEVGDRRLMQRHADDPESHENHAHGQG